MTVTCFSVFSSRKSIEKANHSRYQSFSGTILILSAALCFCLIPVNGMANDFTSTPQRWGGESFIGKDPETGDSIMSITPPAPRPQQQPTIPYIVPQVNMGDWQNQPPKPPIVVPPGYVPPGGIYPPGSFPPGSYPPGGGFPPNGSYPPGGGFPPNGSYPPGGGFPPNGSYPPGGGFPPNGSYPPGGGFPPNGSYPPGGGFPPNGSYPPGGGFPPNGSYPPGGGFPPNGSYPPGSYPPNYPVPYPQGRN